MRLNLLEYSTNSMSCWLQTINMSWFDHAAEKTLSHFRVELAQYKIKRMGEDLLLTHLMDAGLLTMYEEEEIQDHFSSSTRMSVTIDRVSMRLSTDAFHHFLYAVEHIMNLPELKADMVEYYKTQ